MREVITQNTIAMAMGGDQAELPELINEELLTCRICYGKYSLREDQLPKILICSHTFCVHCIKMYLKKSKRSKSKFPCPLCRRETALPKNGAVGLGNDFTVLNLIDILERKNKPVQPPRPPPPSATRSKFSSQSTYSSTIDSHIRKNRMKPGSTVTSMIEKWDLHGETDTNEDNRPPPLNPDFLQRSTPLNALPKPAIPPRIPGAASTLGIRQGRQVGTLLSRRRPQSMRFPTAPRDNTEDLESLSSAGGMSPSRRRRTYSPPRPPPRRVSSDSLAATSIRCLKKFGRYSESRMQTSAFIQPTRIAVSDISGEVLVIDSTQMTLQMFTRHGVYVTMFKVVGVQSACFMGSEKLIVATHRGLGVYKTNGEQTEELPIGHVNIVVPYKFGFVAAKSKQLLLYRNTLKPHRKIKKVKRGRLRTTAFKHIQDICVNSLKEIVVLDTGNKLIYIITSEGLLRATVCPNQQACGAFKLPESITADKWNNILISDTGNRRILKFSANGTFARCLLNFELWSGSDKDICSRGVALNAPHDRMYVVMTGTKLAYIALYQLS